MCLWPCVGCVCVWGGGCLPYVHTCMYLHTYMQAVKTVDSPEKNPKALDNWIDSIAELHRQKPPQAVHYTRYVSAYIHSTVSCHFNTWYEVWSASILSDRVCTYVRTYVYMDILCMILQRLMATCRNNDGCFCQLANVVLYIHTYVCM